MISVERRRDTGVIAQLEAGLDAASIEQRRDPRPPIVVEARARSQLLGGLAAEIVGDWLHVELLWVAESARGRGIGSRLLREAEAGAVADGCVRAYLSTLASQAPDFYRRHGYRSFAELPCFAGPHARTWLAKRLLDDLPIAPTSHQLRASALVFRADRLILVERHDRARDIRWWSPPGGEVRDGESLAASAERATLEATGWPVRVIRLAYVNDALDPVANRRNAELFFLAEIEDHAPLAERDIAGRPKRVKLASREEMDRVRVLPAFLRDDVWNDRAAGFPIVIVRLIGPGSAIQ